MIKVSNLIFDYMTKRALHGLSFEIEKGSIVALIGPNGAGKTTLMRCLAGLVKPFSGEIYLDDINVAEDSRNAHRHISYLSDVFGLYDNLTARQCLRYAALAFDIPTGEIDQRVSETAAMLNLTEHLDTYAGNLSRGLRQRLAIALGIIHKPEFIILDEPTVGLDPIQVVEIRDLIKNLGKRHTVILSSHILSEVQQMCDEILIIAKGKLLAYDTTENLEKQLQPRVLLEVETDASREESEAVLQTIEGIEKTEYAEEDGLTAIRITVAPDRELEIRKLLSRKFAAIDKAVLKNDKIKANLEEIFIELTSPEEVPDGKEEK